MIRTLLVVSLCAWTLQGMGLAHAQAQGEPYPNRPIRMVVPFPAGGPTDGMARIISDRLGEVARQSSWRTAAVAQAAASAPRWSQPLIPTVTPFSSPLEEP